MGTDARSVPAPERIPEIEAIVDRAKAGDQTVLPRLRELLAEFPDLVTFYGNLAAQAEVGWAALAAGPDLYLREALLARAAALRAELGGPSPSLVERMLVGRVVATWMQLNYFVALEPEAILAGESPRLLAFRARRQEQAHRMYLSALAALAMVRRLLPTPVKETVLESETTSRAEPERNGHPANGHAAEADPMLPPRLQDRLDGLFDRTEDGDRPGRSKKPALVAAEN